LRQRACVVVLLDLQVDVKALTIFPFPKSVDSFDEISLVFQLNGRFDLRFVYSIDLFCILVIRIQADGS